MSGTHDGVTREQVLAALRDVLDPELHKSIEELDMVKDVAVTDGRVRVEALLTIGACPLRETIVDSIRAKVAALPGVTGVDVVKALAKRGFQDVAEAVLNIQKQRVSGDYLQTSAVLDRNFNVVAAINDLNDYQGPGTGYRLKGERWKQIADIRHAMRPEDI